MLADVALDSAAAPPESNTAERDDSEAPSATDDARDPPDNATPGTESGLSRHQEETGQGRVISLEGDGEDLIDIITRGRSWIEIDNGEGVRLFNDILQAGDELHIRSNGPFNILFGDASQVAVDFNDEPVDLGSMIRSDNSARIVLER